MNVPIDTGNRSSHRKKQYPQRGEPQSNVDKKPDASPNAGVFGLVRFFHVLLLFGCERLRHYATPGAAELQELSLMQAKQLQTRLRRGLHQNPTRRIGIAKTLTA